MLIILSLYITIFLYHKLSTQKKFLILSDKDLTETPNQIDWVLNRDKHKCQFDWIDVTNRENHVVCLNPSSEIYIVKLRLYDKFFRGNDFPCRALTVCETHKQWLEKSTNLDLALKINLKATNLTKKYLSNNPDDVFPE